MSLPKRDGVKGRYYLIHKPDTSPEVLAEADLCIQDVLNGTARENHSDYPTVVRNHNGTPFLPDQLLERYLSRLPLKGFPCEDAVSLCDAMRRLVCWEEIRYELEKYIEKQVQERFFLVGEQEDGFTVFPPCTVCPELRLEDVDEGLLRFACYVAVCHTVYGQSFESLKTEHILGLVSQLRPDMVKELKANGSGKLPPNIQKRKTKYLTASANDAFATVRITARDCTEECYAEVLDYLCAVLEQEEFPRSYSVEFRGSEKNYLPIPGLPKKGVIEKKASWTRVTNVMKKLLADQEVWDKSLRAMAAQTLTAQANEWLADNDQTDRAPEKDPITEEEFARRILLTEFTVSPGGRFTAWYEDDDMFWGHVVTVDGILKKGPIGADMQG